jgi:hypothetical protein
MIQFNQPSRDPEGKVAIALRKQLTQTNFNKTGNHHVKRRKQSHCDYWSQ